MAEQQRGGMVPFRGLVSGMTPVQRNVAIGVAGVTLLGLVGVAAYFIFRSEASSVPGPPPSPNKSLRRWPVVPYRGSGSTFGAPRPDGRLHAAVDIGTVAGDAIVAVDDGKVLRKIGGYEIGAGLQAVVIAHPDGDYVYAEIKVTAVPGQDVKAGDVIGYAATNNVGNSMLHFEVWESGRGPTYFTKWFPGNKPPGLLNAAEVLKQLPKGTPSVA